MIYNKPDNCNKQAHAPAYWSRKLFSRILLLGGSHKYNRLRARFQVCRKPLDFAFEVHSKRPFDFQIEILLRDNKYVVVVVFEDVLQVIVKALVAEPIANSV
jgi:hypothetical protein